MPYILPSTTTKRGGGVASFLHKVRGSKPPSEPSVQDKASASSAPKGHGKQGAKGADSTGGMSDAQDRKGVYDVGNAQDKDSTGGTDNTASAQSVRYFYNDKKALTSIYFLDSDDFLAPFALSQGVCEFTRLGFDNLKAALFCGLVAYDEKRGYLVPFAHPFSVSSLGSRVYRPPTLASHFALDEVASPSSYPRMVKPWLSWGALYSVHLCESIRFIDGIMLEDTAYAICIIATADAFASINLGAYIYRINRAGSIMSELDVNRVGWAYIGMMRAFLALNRAKCQPIYLAYARARGYSLLDMLIKERALYGARALKSREVLSLLSALQDTGKEIDCPLFINVSASYIGRKAILRLLCGRYLDRKLKLWLRGK